MIATVCAEPSDTRAFGRRLASLLRPGDVVLLSGDLGAGKTVLASGIAEGLGVEEQITSPTFVLAKSYRGLMPLVHADIYRVGSIGELEDLDLLREADEGVLLVEWGTAADQAFPDDHLSLTLTIDDEGRRHIAVAPSGTWRMRPIGEVVA